MFRLFYLILFTFCFNILTIKAANACTPIIELAILFGGYNIFLFFIIFPLKCVFFTYYEKRLPRKKLIWFMLIANLFSSLMGLIMSIPFSSPDIFFGFIPVFIIMAHFPSKRLMARFKWKYLNTALLTVGITLAIIVTIVLFSIAKGYLHSGAIGNYWLFKILYIVVAISISTVLTILWEELIIAKLAKKYLKEDVFFLGSVSRANLASLFIIAFFAALLTIPERLATKGFLLRR